MCGRYYIAADDEAAEELRAIVEEINRRNNGTQPLAAMAAGEVFPTNIAPVVAADGPRLMRWGFPMYGKSGVTINARSESAADKSMFSAALRTRRIVVPTSGFYEWEHDEKGKSKDKFLFSLPGRNVLYLAGLHTNYALPDGKREDRYVILTTEANDSMRPYHNRMPVYIDRKESAAWIGDPKATEEILRRVQPELLATKCGAAIGRQPTSEPPKQTSMFDLQ